MYDAIVVGARCAGSPTAMLLARRGYRVLLVDRATFPSDTMSTHYIHPPGLRQLERWGLLDDVRALGAPPITRARTDFGDFAVDAAILALDGIAEARCIRRTVLDAFLAERAVKDGAELRQGFTLEELVLDDGAVVGVRGHERGGASVEERARIVVGADGMRSLVARAVDAPRYDERPSYGCGYYSYWSGVSLEDVRFFLGPGRVIGAFPTNDGLACVFTGRTVQEFEDFRRDVEGGFFENLALAPEFAEQVRAGAREERFVGTRDIPGFFRKPYGAGWALVGDAGYHKDPITADGITDAFRDAELLTGAIDEGFAGRHPLEEALAGYERARNVAAKPFYDWTCNLAMLQPRPPQVDDVLRALVGNPEQAARLFAINAEMVTPQEFFSPENVAAILGR